MSNRRIISQAGVGRFTRVLALSGLVIVACQPSGIDDPPSVVVPSGTPIQQDDRIPIEIDVNGEWVPAHPSLAGLERFAQQWCARSRRAGDDAKLCANAGATTGTTAPSDFPGCNALLCAERNSVCAGYIFEELAKSPQQRVLDPREIVAGGNSTVGGTIAVWLDSTGLDLSKAELDGFGRTLPDVKTPRLRFQPLDAPGRAAALRAALDMFRDSARVASILRTQASPNDGLTCLLRFGLTDLAKTGLLTS